MAGVTEYISKVTKAQMKELLIQYQNNMQQKGNPGYYMGKLNEDGTKATLVDGTTVDIITKGLPGSYAPVYLIGGGKGLVDQEEPNTENIDSNTSFEYGVTTNNGSFYLHDMRTNKQALIGSGSDLFPEQNGEDIYNTSGTRVWAQFSNRDLILIRLYALASEILNTAEVVSINAWQIYSDPNYCSYVSCVLTPDGGCSNGQSTVSKSSGIYFNSEFLVDYIIFKRVSIREEVFTYQSIVSSGPIQGENLKSPNVSSTGPEYEFIQTFGNAGNYYTLSDPDPPNPFPPTCCVDLGVCTNGSFYNVTFIVPPEPQPRILFDRRDYCGNESSSKYNSLPSFHYNSITNKLWISIIYTVCEADVVFNGAGRGGFGGFGGSYIYEYPIRITSRDSGGMSISLIFNTIVPLEASNLIGIFELDLNSGNIVSVVRQIDDIYLASNLGFSPPDNYGNINFRGASVSFSRINPMSDILPCSLDLDESFFSLGLVPTAGIAFGTYIAYIVDSEGNIINPLPFTLTSGFSGPIGNRPIAFYYNKDTSDFEYVFPSNIEDPPSRWATNQTPVKILSNGRLLIGDIESDGSHKYTVYSRNSDGQYRPFKVYTCDGLFYDIASIR